MTTKVIITDAGPLIALAKVDLLSIFKKSSFEFWAPQAVIREATADGSKPGAAAIQDAVASHWIQEKTVEHDDLYFSLRKLLDEGEAEAISLANRNSTAVLIDETRGRKVAQRKNIPVLGTAALLIHAKEEGFIPEVMPILNILKLNGYRLSSGLMLKVQELAIIA